MMDGHAETMYCLLVLCTGSIQDPLKNRDPQQPAISPILTTYFIRLFATTSTKSTLGFTYGSTLFRFNVRCS